MMLWSLHKSPPAGNYVTAQQISSAICTRLGIGDCGTVLSV
jgi:hypothetical protein